MSYIVFARKYRPKDFDEIIGQEHITTTLKNAISKKRVAHAYLFSGPRGIGKTTTARILAKALNCEKGPTTAPCDKCVSCREISSSTSMDVIEIDGASNRGIDEVRQLRENVKFSPVHGAYKLYIIDEVHMLTQEAFNALLKTLEEPPPHVKFIFATTQPNKVIATVSSRCQRFDFRRISVADIVSKLKEIAKNESIKVDEEAFFSIARQAEGSLRDAESILDQLNTFCNGDIKKEDITHILGTVSDELLGEFTDIIISKDSPRALQFTDKLLSEGKDLSFFILNLISHVRNLMVAKVCTKPQGLIDAAPQTVERLIRQAKDLTQEEFFYISSILVAAYESMKRSTSVRVLFEMAVVRITKRASLAPLGEILDRIKMMERRIERGELTSNYAKPVKSAREYYSEPSPTSSEAPVKPQEEKPRRPAATVDVAEIKEENKVAQGLPAEEVPVGDIELSAIEELWPTFLKVVKSKKMSVASYLLEGNLHTYGNGCLTISFPKNYSLHKEALERPDNALLIENILSEILQRKIRVKFALQDVPREGDVSAGKDGRKSEENTTQEALKEPLIQSALDVFDGRIIPKRNNFRNR